jgi:hypothetical protein
MNLLDEYRSEKYADDAVPTLSELSPEGRTDRIAFRLARVFMATHKEKIDNAIISSKKSPPKI